MGLEEHQERPGREVGIPQHRRDEKRNRQGGRQAPVGYTIRTWFLPRSGPGLHFRYCPVRYFCLGRYLLPTVMAVALSHSRDPYLNDLSPDSVDLEEVPSWVKKIAALDPTGSANMKADRTETLLTERLLRVIASVESKA